MSRVSLSFCKSYRGEDLLPALQKVVELCGGMESLVRPGDRVLLKPNLLCARGRERRITTDPAVVKAVASMVLDCGGEPLIADSPALETFDRVARKSGMLAVARELGCGLEGLCDPRQTPVPEGAVFRNLELARQVFEADVILNLPKLKTHGQMLLTLGVKNLFGTVVAQRKAEWHLVAGLDRERFASLLLDIHTAVSPGLTILDGVWGMEGCGPQNGEPKFLGLVAASRNALAMDLAICDLLAAPRRQFPLFRAAADRRLLPHRITWSGDDPQDLGPDSFKLPQLDSLDFLPRGFPGWARRGLVSKPVHDREACRRCGDCVDICPSQAMKLSAEGMVFDYDACIRCFCCQEICPHDAIGFKKGWLQQGMGLIGR